MISKDWKLRIVTIVLISILISVLILVIIHFFSSDPNAIQTTYANNMRNALFTGSISVGSFLLSFKTFIIAKLKENIYDTPLYQETFQKNRELDKNIRLYDPLKNLSSLLFIAIISCIFSSITQLSFGLMQHWLGSYLCIFFAGFSACLLLFTLILIKFMIDSWLDISERINMKKMSCSEK